MTLHDILTEKEREWRKRVGFLRQWLNEDRITDHKKMIDNYHIEYWLKLNPKEDIEDIIKGVIEMVDGMGFRDFEYHSEFSATHMTTGYNQALKDLKSRLTAELHTITSDKE